MPLPRTACLPPLLPAARSFPACAGGPVLEPAGDPADDGF